MLCLLILNYWLPGQILLFRIQVVVMKGMYGRFRSLVIYERPVLALPGLVTGRRINQEHKFPEFIETLPLSLLSEFLGGLFGGDVHAQILTYRGKKNRKVTLQCSINLEYRDSSQKTV